MDVVRTILAREFPGRTLSSVERIDRGNNKRTSVASFRTGDPLVVQLSPDRTALQVETTLAGMIRERTSVPTPQVFAEGVHDDVGYVVVELAEGDDLHARFSTLGRKGQQRLARTFGRALAELHREFTFDGYGPVNVEDDRLRAANGHAWRAWFDEYAEEGLSDLPPALGGVRDAVDESLDEAAVPERPSAVLYPWDFRPGNALVSDGRLSAVIDWGAPLAADAGLSVAKTEHLVADWYADERRPLREAFRAGYEAVRPYPDVPDAYRQVAVVRSAVDSAGVVTRPLFPEVDGDDAIAFHRERASEWL